MAVLGIALAAVLVVLTILFVARPFLRAETGDAGPLRAPKTPRREVVELLEERDRALLALQELDFDLRAGTISPADHKRFTPSLRSDAAEALRQLAEIPRSRQAVRQAKSADGLPSDDRPGLKRPQPPRTEPRVS